MSGHERRPSLHREEKGSESVQFTFAALFLFAMVFGTLNLALMNTASATLSAELSRACLRIDVPGLQAAQDKEAFVREQLADGALALSSANLSVSNVSVRSRQRELPAASQDGVSQRSVVTSVAYDVAYTAPLAYGPAGAGDGRLCRHVACSVEDERVVEVSGA